ncbi:hypothetical protein NW754_008685 [Fusarium falciforme]|nr:hypothetical protein NW754_008685 [Fusarium falciforme]
MASGPEFTAKEVAVHNTSDDCWMTIQGQVYDVTKYIHDHPGGADILIEAAGKDATVDFDNAGHSEDAFEIMAEYRVGKYKGAPRKDAPKRVTLQPKATPKPKSGGRTSAVVATAAVSSALALHQAYRFNPGLLDVLPAFKLSSKPNRGLGFFEGFILASALFTVAGTYAVKSLSKFLHFEEGGFMSYPPHKKMPKVSKPNPLIQRGWLDPSASHALPLTEKELIAPNVYRLVFALPTPTTVLGLPIGQHLSIKADVGGKSVNRSYTPISNNSDLGTLELGVTWPTSKLEMKCYSEDLRAPCVISMVSAKKIGMLAGGTGITPMFQIIRAICEDDRDLTEVSLIYANRSEEDILLRKELESFARRYPQSFKLYYLLDNAPADWKYGTGYVTQELMAERFPAPGPDSKVMLCGPPGMISAAKKSLVNLGFEKPGASPKMTDQVFCF